MRLAVEEVSSKDSGVPKDGYSIIQSSAGHAWRAVKLIFEKRVGDTHRSLALPFAGRLSALTRPRLGRRFQKVLHHPLKLLVFGWTNLMVISHDETRSV
jgi:hypothetical protein